MITITVPTKITLPTTITCQTQATNKTSLDALVVLDSTGGAGRAVPQAKLQVVDVWSSHYSWGNNPPPKKGILAFSLCNNVSILSTKMQHFPLTELILNYILCN